METGISRSPGSQPARAEHRGAVRGLELLLREEPGPPGREGRSGQPAGGEVLALSVCVHSLDLCAQHSAGQDTQAVSGACH